MTKKDYILIADCLNTLIKSTKLMIKDNAITKINVNFCINQTINKFYRKLKEDNNRFNQDKFLKAVNK